MAGIKFKLNFLVYAVCIAACGSLTPGVEDPDGSTHDFVPPPDSGTPNSPKPGNPDAGLPNQGQPDSGTPDSGTQDSGTQDAGSPDAGKPDSGTTTPDAGAQDAGTLDAGTQDSGTVDSGTKPDSGTPDAGTQDAGSQDAGTPDAGTQDSGTVDSGTAPDAGTTPPPVDPTLPVNTNPKAKPAADFVPGPAYTPNPKFTELLTREQFEKQFPFRAGLYNYDALAAAAAQFPEFVSVGTLEQRKQELAAFLANIAHETTGGWPTAPGGPYAYGLYWPEEMNCDVVNCTSYCDATNTEFPCAPGKKYYGRGPIQLSWNYNYGLAGRDLGYPDLLTNPDQITKNPYLAMLTGIWFWMRPQAPKPSCHDVMTGKWVPTEADKTHNRLPGFGMTILIINGGIECNSGSNPSENSVNRVEHLKHFSQIMGVALPQTSIAPRWHRSGDAYLEFEKHF